MKTNRNIRARAILAALYFVIGASIFIYGEFATIDSFWSGLGTALMVIGALQTIRLVRYQTNPQYKENTDTAIHDERNRFLSTKAWSWAGYLYVLIAAVSTIAFHILDQEILRSAASGSLCLILVLYWLSYLILRKKY